ncbi:Protein CBR-RNF-5 [Caenorhabditis briggsae]|uniref:RING-type E3 ubiquitin transferase n=2 Tax=Caenorhabditis briggsae TaxID=6238 RepID=A0AAE9DFY3_CAEBR|nr:Protein CBR-RNF-5 [Caenorhabditis briggsae]ULU02692.1 hypothetical protein L3Y34_002345 [Caenorhabditis briggsae]CAP37280.1 Protein CBR-RNF-5 [Caenorhabditis briggsae]
MASGTTQAPPEEPPGSSNKDESARFECNICLDAARDAVVSLCGHLFCWPCLSQWLDTRPNNQVCPVCKSAIDGTKVVPIYGRGGDTTDPRTKIPPRPKGQRSEPQQSSFGGFNWGGFNDGGGMMGGGVGHNVHFSFGIGTVNPLFPLMFMLPFIQGIFPLSFVASWFNNGNPGQENGVGGGAPGNQGQPGQPGAQERGPGPYGRVHSETAAPGSRMAQEEEYLSNIFKYIGIFMLLWLFLV